MHKKGSPAASLIIGLLLALLPAITFTACKNKNSITVEGSVNKKTSNLIYINRIDIDTPVLIDSAKLTRHNRFRIKINAREPDFYQVGYNATNFITLLAEPGEKIELGFTSDNLYNGYTVSGSKSSGLVRILDNKLLRTKASLDSLTSLYNQAKNEPGFETKGPVLEKEYTRLAAEQRKFNIVFIINNINSLASIKALYQRLNEQTYVLYEMRDLQYLKIVSDSLLKHYPELKLTKALVSNFEKEMNQFRARELQKITESAPEVKLDPDLKDINGKKVVLSSLKGRYVLLAFWSVESRECIAENLQLKEFYNMYKNKGFEIYQINLDNDETAWKEAVRFDALPWISTREENPADPKFARIYNVRSVPANFLYDTKGEIIASNLHGKSLQIKLNQLFNN
jgi:thioredoxin-related protein